MMGQCKRNNVIVFNFFSCTLDYFAHLVHRPFLPVHNSTVDAYSIVSELIVCNSHIKVMHHKPDRIYNFTYVRTYILRGSNRGHRAQILENHILFSYIYPPIRTRPRPKWQSDRTETDRLTDRQTAKLDWVFRSTSRLWWTPVSKL